MATALITGGAGFIGSHLSEKLLAQGYSVIVLDDLSTGRRENIAHLIGHPDFAFVEGSILDAGLVQALVDRAEIIFHLAAAVGVQKIISEPVRSIETNINGTENLLRAAQARQTRILLASTSEVYGKGVRFPFHEDDDTLMGPTSRNRWSYAASKAIDEFLALAYHDEYGLPVVIFRLFNTVGPRQSGQYGMVLPRFVRWALDGEPVQVYGDGQQQRCFANVHDAVDGITALAGCDAAVGNVYNIGNNEEVTIEELARRVIQRTGSSSPIVHIPYDRAYNNRGFEDFRRRVPSIARIGAATGWKPRITLDETIDQIVTFYRGN
jgi:UDP-glucose 4-epimerase